MLVLAVSLGQRELGAPAVLGCVLHAVTSSASDATCALLRKVLEGGQEVVDIEIALDNLCGGVQVLTAPHFGLAAPPSAPTAGGGSRGSPRSPGQSEPPSEQLTPSPPPHVSQFIHLPALGTLFQGLAVKQLCSHPLR